MKSQAWRTLIVCDYLHEMSSSKIITHAFGGFREVLKCINVCLLFPPTPQLHLSRWQFSVALILTSQARIQMADLKIGGEEVAAMEMLCEWVFLLFSLSCFPPVISKCFFKQRQTFELVIKLHTNCELLKKSVTCFATFITEKCVQQCWN